MRKTLFTLLACLCCALCEAQKDSITLNEVVVTATMKLTKVTHNGISYDLQADKISQSADLLTALRRVPLISVDGKDNILVKGSGSFAIYLNGRPYRIAQTAPAEILRSIPAATVARIEVITRPSGRYAQEDAGAIINIVTSRRVLDGYSLTLTTGADTQPKANAGASMLGKKGNVDFNLGYNYDLNGQRKQPAEQRQRINATGNTANLNGIGDGDWITHTLRAMAEWQTDSLNTVYIDAHGLWKNTKFDNQWEQLSSADGQRSTFRSHNANWAGTLEANAIYRNYFRRAKDKERFYIGYRYTYTPDVRKFQEQTKNEGEAAFGDPTINNTDGGMHEHTAMGNLCLPLARQHDLHFGGKMVFRNGKTNSSSGDDMRYHQDLASVYAAYAGQMGKLALSGSLRWEYADLQMNTPSVVYRHHTHTLLPRISVDWQITDRSSLSIGYNKSVQRPSIAQLNPYRNKYSSYMGSEGNASLSPSATHSLEADYMLTTGKWFLSGGLSYRLTRDAIVGYMRYASGSALLTDGYANIDRTLSLGGNFYVSYRPLPLLSISIMGDVASYKMQWGDKGLNQRQWTYNAAAICDLYFGHNWIAGVQYGNYLNAPAAWAKAYPFAMYSAYVGKSFGKGAWNVRLTANSPFAKYSHYKSLRTHSDYTFWQRNYITARAVGISVAYTLRHGSTKQLQRNRQLENKDVETGVR